MHIAILLEFLDAEQDVKPPIIVTARDKFGIIFLMANFFKVLIRDTNP